jgi:hypothetical protein
VIELIEGLPAPVVGLRVEGEVTREDYERVLLPAVARAREGHEKLRLLYVIGDDFDGYSMGAIWEDAKLGAHSLLAWERIAVVTDVGWIRHLMAAFGWMIHGEIRVVGTEREDEARAWVTEGLPPA